jgi:peptidyl-prolyl cis-trans isomerase D
MVEALRSKGLKNVVYGVVIVAVGFAFLSTGTQGPATRLSSWKAVCVANVRSRCISPAEFNASATLLRQILRKNDKRQAVEGIIERELLLQEADRLGMGVTDDEVTAQLKSGFIRFSQAFAEPVKAPRGPEAQGVFPAHEQFLNKNTKQFEMKTYSRFVSQITGGMSDKEFREFQAHELLAAKVRELVQAPVRVSEAESYELYVRQNTNATLSYVEVRDDFAADSLVETRQADIDAWVKDHQVDVDKAFEEAKKTDLPKATTVRHILVMFNGDSQAKKDKALERISLIAARIKAGEPFGTVARASTEDPGSKSSGGAYEEKMVDGFVESFKKAFASLKPGQMTDTAIESSYGYHLIMRDDPTRAGATEAAVKKAVILDLYRDAKAKDAAKAFADRVQAQIKGGKTPDEALSALLKPVKIQLLGVTADVKAPSGDAGAPEAPKTDANVKPKTAEVLPANAPEFKTSARFNRTGDLFSSDINPKDADKIRDFAFAAKDGEWLADIARGREGNFLVMLKDRKTASREDYEKARDTHMSTLLTGKQSEALSMYMKQLRDRAKADIKINNDFFKDEKADGGAATSSSDDDGE